LHPLSLCAIRLIPLVLPAPDGFKALLRELLWLSTYSSIHGGPAATRVALAGTPSDALSLRKAETAFSQTVRAWIVELLRDTLDVSTDVAVPSLPQQTIVDVMYMIWWELEQIKREVSHLPPPAPVSPAATVVQPTPEQDLNLTRDRLLACLMTLKEARSTLVFPPAATANGTAPAPSPPSVPVLPQVTMKSVLQPDFLDALGGLMNSSVLTKMMVNFRTSAWYRQQKFNLLREETEGFSKLFTELHTFFQLPATNSDVNLLLKRVQSYIGFFDLEPNRVMDVILDAYERGNLYNNTSQLGNWLKLLEEFNNQNLIQIIGWKFRNYWEQFVAAHAAAATIGGAAGKTPGLIGPAPPALFDLAAILIRTGRIPLEALYSHLSPSDELMALARSDYLAEEKKKAAKANVVSLSKAKEEDEPESKAAATTKGGGTAVVEKISSAGRDQQGIASSGAEEKKEEISLVLAGTPITTVGLEAADKMAMQPPPAAAAAPPPPAPVEPEKKTIKIGGPKEPKEAPAAAPATSPAAAAPAPPPPNIPYPQNQKLQLLASLLNQNAWTHAEVLLQHFLQFNPASHAGVGQALADFVSRMIRPLYVPISSAWRRFAGSAKGGKVSPTIGPNGAVLLSAVHDSSHSIGAFPGPEDPHSQFLAWSALG
jgi:hypothetical protein